MAEQPPSRRRREKEEEAAAAPRANAAPPPRLSVAAAAASAVPKNVAPAASSSSAPTGPDQPGVIPITYKQLQAAAAAAAAEGSASTAAKASTKSTKAAGGSKRRSNAATAAVGAAAPPPPPPPSSSPLSTAVRERLSHFESSAAMRDRALALYVNDALFTEAAATFSETFASAAAGASSSAAASAASSALAALPLGPASDAALFPLFADHVVSRYSRRVSAYRDVVRALDMTSPHLWFPAARALAPRRVTYHAGPTNSGKTHSALEALASADSGVYCGPLRLLAMEVADDLNARGVRCDLVTGQEARLVPGSRHVACTVEMAEVRVRSGGEKVKKDENVVFSSLSTEDEQPLLFDVAVLDEIQLIGDPSRGWAWTRALHGLPAKELHVCGDGSAAALVEALCRRSGDDFELVRHRRFRPLRVDEAGLPRGLADVRPGDCVVAFSRAVSSA